MHPTCSYAPANVIMSNGAAQILPSLSQPMLIPPSGFASRSCLALPCALSVCRSSPRLQCKEAATLTKAIWHLSTAADPSVVFFSSILKSGP